MRKYFLQDREVPETEAAGHWFAYAGNQNIDIGRAISIWEDAGSPAGPADPALIGAAGIRVETDADG